MSGRTRSLVVAAIVCGIAAVAPGRADACTCAPTSLADAVQLSQVVAIVDVGEARREPDGAMSASVTFHTVLRGPMSGQRIFWTPPNGKSCDFVDLKPGRWLLFARWGTDGRLSTVRCDANSAPVKRALVTKKVAELMTFVKAVKTEAEAVAAARAAVNPMLIASALSRPGGELSGVDAASDLARVDRATVTREQKHGWRVRWSQHPPAGMALDAEVLVAPDGVVQVVRAEATFSPD